MTNLPFHYMVEGEFNSAITWVFTNYIMHGLLWVFIGIILFAVIQTKTKSFGISGVVLIIYFSILSIATIDGQSLIMPVIQPFILLLIGILGAVMFIKIIRG